MWVFELELIKRRLSETQFGFESVNGVAEYAVVEKNSSFRPNTVFVVPMREQNPAGAEPQPRAKSMAAVTFGVIAVAKNVRDSRGEEALKDALEIVGRVRQALIGWVPEGCKPCIWLQGDVTEYNGTNLLYIDAFTTSYVIGA